MDEERKQEILRQLPTMTRDQLMPIVEELGLQIHVEMLDNPTDDNIRREIKKDLETTDEEKEAMAQQVMAMIEDQDDLAKLREQVRGFHELVTERTAENETLRSRASELEGENRELRNQNAWLENSQREATARFEEIQKNFTELDRETEQVQAKADETDRQLAKLGARLTDVGRKLQEETVRGARRGEELARSRTALREMRHRAERWRAMTYIASGLAVLFLLAAIFLGGCDSSKKELATAKQEIANLKAQASKDSAAIASLNHNLAKTIVSLDSLQGEFNAAVKPQGQDVVRVETTPEHERVVVVGPGGTQQVESETQPPSSSGKRRGWRDRRKPKP